MKHGFVLLVALSAVGCRGLRTIDTDAIVRDVLLVIAKQAKAWNEGDVEAFMEGYLPSTELTFASEEKVTRGWDATLERYKARYPDKAAMGRVTFSDLEVLPLGATSAYVLGRFALKREAPLEDKSGRFTLIFLRTPKGWKIVHDHTSAAQSESDDS